MNKYRKSYRLSPHCRSAENVNYWQGNKLWRQYRVHK